MKILTKVRKISLVAVVLVAVAILAPVVTEAAGLIDFIQDTKDMMSRIVPIMLSLGVIAFFYGLAKYLFTDGEDKGKGMNIMMMGILAVFVMASLQGIISVLRNTTGATKNQQIKAPCVGDCQNKGTRAVGGRSIGA